MVARLPALELALCRNYHSLPVHTGLDAPRAVGCTDLHSLGAPSGRRNLAVLCPPCLCPSQGERRIIGCVCPVPWDLGPLCRWNCAPRAMAPEGSRAQTPLSGAHT